jgi:plastocyanin
MLLALLVCLSGGSALGQPGNAVSIRDYSYQPGTLTVAAGTTVTWTNDGNVPHTVTSNERTFDSGDIAPGGTFSYTFNQPGSYPYHCSLHPSMQGQIEVTSGTVTPATQALVAPSATPSAIQYDVSQYTQYYEMTGEAAPTTPITTPEEYDIKGKEPSMLYFYGPQNPIPYSQYQTYATYTGGNSLWIQGATSWTQYAKVPQGARLSLIALTSTPGNGYLYEIYPSGKLVKNNYYFYPYNRINYYADEVGQHVLLFVLNNYPSNAMLIDVVKYSPPAGGYQPPVTYQQPSGYQQQAGYQQSSSYQSTPTYQQSGGYQSSGGY